MTNKKDMRFSKADQAIQDSFLELLKKMNLARYQLKKSSMKRASTGRLSTPITWINTI